MKRLVLISGSDATRRALVSQLEDLFENRVEVESYALDNGPLRQSIGEALVLLTSSLLLDQCSRLIDHTCQVVVAKRTLDFANLEKVYAIREGSSILIVNDVLETAVELIEILKKLGFDKYQYYSYCPGADMVVEPIDFVITPGEVDLVPKKFDKIIDIGARILDITTIVEIVKKLEMFDTVIHEKIHLISAKYISKIISLRKELHVKHEKLKNLNDFLLNVIHGVDDGIVAYDKCGKVELINRIASDILCFGEGANIIEETKANDKKLNAFLIEESLENYILQKENATYLFSKINSGSMGFMLLLIKNVRERINLENRLKSELKKQGYRAKYTFNDLIHRSEKMREVIAKGKMLAESEFSILIYGESGTGKEIFASAVHNASARRDGPFLAVNFSALPDELIESELFGYEEGAFTGAKRGGRIGLFELANQGTLFLDEIGDTSPKIQSRLLRVLQEKEVLRVGGAKNIPVDVRVVAATNKDLHAMVKAGTFREDLYYRLKKLYVHIPPLRERKDDIQPLFNHFLIQKNGFGMKLTDEARNLLFEYGWPGNVRELENNVEYILAVRKGDFIDRSVLSEDLLDQVPPAGSQDGGAIPFLLKTIGEFNAAGRLIGRRRLSELSSAVQLDLSEHQVRRILENLSEKGLLRMGKGRTGLWLTHSGRGSLASS